jgi:hypothetical protein
MEDAPDSKAGGGSRELSRGDSGKHGKMLPIEPLDPNRDKSLRRQDALGRYHPAERVTAGFKVRVVIRRIDSRLTS